MKITRFLAEYTYAKKANCKRRQFRNRAKNLSTIGIWTGRRMQNY